MKPANFIALRLRSLAAASASSFLAVRQRTAGNHHLAHKAAEHSSRRRAEAGFFECLELSAILSILA